VNLPNDFHSPVRGWPNRPLWFIAICNPFPACHESDPANPASGVTQLNRKQGNSPTTTLVTKNMSPVD
jgi:hypothetical protein